MHAPAASTDTGAYEAGLTVVGEFNTVEGFCRYFNWLKPPSNLERNSNYHIFKDGIKPMWEDPENANVPLVLPRYPGEILNNRS